MPSRKIPDVKLVITSIQADVRLLGELEKMANKAGISRNKLIVNILRVGVDELKAMDQVGVLAFARVITEWQSERKQRQLKFGMAPA